jgi:TolB protein
MLPLALLLAAPPPAALAGHEFLVTTVRTGDTEIARVDPATGDVRNLSRNPGTEDRYPCWSPDGKRVAFTSDRDGEPFQLYVTDADGGNVRRVGNFPGTCYMPSWGGDRIAFGLHGDKPLMASVRPDGSDLKLLGDGHDPCLSPDGKRIAYTGHVKGGVTVFVMDADGGNKRCLAPEPNPVGAVFPAWSPDGKRVVFSKNVGPALELFTVAADGTDLKQLTRTGAVCTPAAWSPDGRWISFRRTDERYWSDPVKVKKVYADKPADKRPVWVIRPDGADAHVVECLRFQCAMDGSRAAWKPKP